MISTARVVALREVLNRSSNAVVASPEGEYLEITVRLWGKGVVLRRIAKGSEIAGSRRYVARAGQFIVSRIDARNGAMGVVPGELDGAVVSSDFPVFDVNPSLATPEYLDWLCKTRDFVALCGRASEGTTNRVRLKEERFLSLELALPSLEEQRRVVARVEELAEKILYARSLIVAVNSERELLLQALLLSDPSPRQVTVGDLLTPRPPDVTVRPEEEYQFAGVYSFGRGVFVGQPRSGMEFDYKRVTRLRVNDFVYPKLMAWEGALGVVPEECAGCVVSPEFPVFTIDQTRILPQVVDVYFSRPDVWPTLSGVSTGTNVRRRRLNPRQFLAHKMPLPSPAVQRRLAASYDYLAKLVSMRTVMTDELNALLPAILDRAFKGEL